MPDDISTVHPNVSPYKGDPYLRVFDPGSGAREVYIKELPLRIGRSPDSHLFLNNPSVSRKHAEITQKSGIFFINDLESTSGTILNRQPVAPGYANPLKPGDILQIVDFVIEFRCGTPKILDQVTIQSKMTRSESEDLSKRQVFLDRFRFLPTIMTAEYRIINSNPALVFKAGDTVRLGEGGLLIATERTVPRPDKIIEVEILWPDNRKRRFLTELLAALPNGKSTFMGLKLHNVPPDKYEQIVSAATRSEWVASLPPM